MAPAPAEGDDPAFIPNDIIFDILSRLPIKNVCRFRCVSRGWDSLICGPEFLAVHKAQSQPLLISSHEQRVQLVDMGGNVVRELKTDCFFRNILSTEGLVFTIGVADADSKLMDLATGKVVVFTCLKPATTRNTIDGCGPATLSGAHKVVCVGAKTCAILTLEDGAGWRMTQSPPLRVKQYCSPVVIDGVLYALASSKQSTRHNPDSVICFDLESEKWNRVIKSPPQVESNLGWFDHIGELTGMLCLVQSEVLSSDPEYTHIWSLTNSDKSIWVKLFTMPMDTSYKCIPIPLRVMHGGKLLYYCLHSPATAPILKVFDPLEGTSTDAVKSLDQRDGRFHICNLDLGDFVSAKK